MTDGTARPNLYGLPRAELSSAFAPLDDAPFRARQVFAHLYRHDALDPAAWSDFPVPLRAAAAAAFRIERPIVVTRAYATDGTQKATLDLPGGGRVEAVAIPDGERMTYCISSQVGCAFGCGFCMTARLGFLRHLTAGEIVGQVAALHAETGTRPGEHNIVFMGMGEPLHNFDAVMESIALLTDADGFALGPRRLTVSTVGLPHRIVAMAERAVPVRLAVSLVAADQDVRAGLMPVARRHPLNDLVDAIRRYGEGRRDHPTLEVVLLDGVNDDRRLARKLVEFARRARAKVNLIEFNPTPELPFRPSPEATIQMFLRVLGDGGVVGTVRRSRGGDAYAACGQLAFLERRT